jgi:hypothetical protein
MRLLCWSFWHPLKASHALPLYLLTDVSNIRMKFSFINHFLLVINTLKCKKLKPLFHPVFPFLRKDVAFVKVSRVHLFVLLVRIWVWSTGGMILIVENGSDVRRFCPSGTLSIRDITWIEPGPNSGFRSKRLATNCLSRGTPWRVKWLYSTYKYSICSMSVH